MSSTAPIRFFHRTSTEAAASILAHGFRDAVGTYGLVGLDEPLCGVFVSDVPVTCNEGSKEGQDGGVLFEITFDSPATRQFNDESVAIGDPVTDHREWVVPASLINEHGVVRVVPCDESWT